MKEELNSKLVEILTSIQTAAGKASDFALEQLPDIAQSYVLYGRVYSLVALFLCLLVFPVVVWVMRKTYKETVHGNVDEIVWLPVGLGSFAATLVSVLVFLNTLPSALLVWFAPKVWLLKELASLVK